MHDTLGQTIQKPCSNAVQRSWVTTEGTHIFISQHAARIISMAAITHVSYSEFALPGLELNKGWQENSLQILMSFSGSPKWKQVNKNKVEKDLH